MICWRRRSEVGGSSELSELYRNDQEVEADCYLMPDDEGLFPLNPEAALKRGRKGRVGADAK